MYFLKHNPKNQKSRNFLKNAGIFDYYKYENETFSLTEGDVTSTLGFNRFTKLDGTLDVVEKILGTASVKLEDNLKNSLKSKIFEIFSNAFTHGESEIGVFTCGYFNESNDFSFSVYDAGIGIYGNVNKYIEEYPESQINEIKLDHSGALRWALQKGNSTLNGKVDFPRGAGLYSLESFVKANKGKIYLTSQSGYCLIDGEDKEFYNLSKPIIGTLFSMVIKADNRHIYYFK